MSRSAGTAHRWSVSTMQRVAAETTVVEAALRFADLGIPVFPCLPGEKRPMTSSGFHDATTSTRRVHEWWHRTPEANIGLPTGAATGFVVVDIDVHPGGSGFASFERARTEGLGDDWGWLVRTPSGGIHAYYPAMNDREQRCWQVPSAHVDFRGDGGYVIAPPSRIEVDGVVKWYDVIATATHGAKPIDAIALRHFLEPPRSMPAVPSPDLSVTACRPEALARTVALTQEGGRNRTLFWASCRLVENGHSRADTVGALMPAAQHAGLPDREIEATIDSAFRIASRSGSALGVRAESDRVPVHSNEVLR